MFFFINFNNILDLFTNGGNRSCLFLELLMGDSMSHRYTQEGEGGKGDDIGPPIIFFEKCNKTQNVYPP
jgi:hypothetical protein